MKILERMNVFRTLLVLFLIGICAYTVSTITNYGYDLVTPFFGGMLSFTWTGQFIFDFQTYLILSGLWVAWRKNFSLQGMLLGVIALIFGIMFFAPYLLILSYKEKEDWKAILLGDRNK